MELNDRVIYQNEEYRIAEHRMVRDIFTRELVDMCHIYKPDKIAGFPYAIYKWVNTEDVVKCEHKYKFDLIFICIRDPFENTTSERYVVSTNNRDITFEDLEYLFQEWREKPAVVLVAPISLNLIR
jgi:hypothetical protein